MKEYIKERHKKDMMLYTLNMGAFELGWECVGFDRAHSKFKIISNIKDKAESGVEFDLLVHSPCTTPWIHISTMARNFNEHLEDKETVFYHGRCKDVKTLKRIMKLLNIK